MRKASEEKQREDLKKKSLVPEDFEKFLPPKDKPKQQDLPQEPFGSPWKQKTPFLFEKDQKKE